MQGVKAKNRDKKRLKTLRISHHPFELKLLDADTTESQPQSFVSTHILKIQRLLTRLGFGASNGIRTRAVCMPRNVYNAFSTSLAI